MRLSNSGPLTSIAGNQSYLGLEGTYVASGWSVTVGESGSSIELDIEAGEGYLENEPISTTEGQVTLPSGDAEPRKDVIYITSAGAIEVLVGVSENPVDDRDGNQIAHHVSPVPAPHDFEDINGIPIAYVAVPADAENTSDLEANYVEDIRLFVEIGGGGGQVDQRTITTGTVALDDGDFYDEAFSIGSDDTVRVIQWGVVESSNGGRSLAPTGARVALAGESGTVVSSEETSYIRDEDGLVEDSGDQHYAIRVVNDTGSDYKASDGEGLAAHAIIEVV